MTQGARACSVASLLERAQLQSQRAVMVRRAECVQLPQPGIGPSGSSRERSAPQGETLGCWSWSVSPLGDSADVITDPTREKIAPMLDAVLGIKAPAITATIPAIKTY